MNHINITLPKEVIEDYLKYGLLGFAEIHGIQENYEFYEEVIRQLPVVPNLAFEITEDEIETVEHAIRGEKYDPNKIGKDFRINKQLIDFIKSFKKEYPDKKIFYFDLKNKDTQLLSSKKFSRDELMANNFLDQFDAPTVVISGNLHLEKEYVLRESDTHRVELLPMGYFIKNKIGDFPVLFFNPLDVSYSDDEDLNTFLQRTNNRYFYFFIGATPATRL